MITKEDYIQRVLLIMNEAGLFDKNGNSYIGADAAQIDRYIEGSFVDAWRNCAAVLPKAWFFNRNFIGQTRSHLAGERTGYVILPNDFYQLNQFKMSTWRKAALDAYIENERTASIQSNPYTRGSEIRPVVTISTKTVNGVPTQVLNYYSCEPGASVDKAIYIPVATALDKLENNDEINLDQRVIEPLAYLSAATVFTIFEKYDVAQAIEVRVAEMFPAFQSIKGTNVTIKR